MGVDAPLAVLSKKTRSFFDYFHQLFAQVTNPPIDACARASSPSSVLYLGNTANLLETAATPVASCACRARCSPMDAFRRICAIDRVGFRTQVFHATYRRDAGEGALEAALDALDHQIEDAVRAGTNIVVISDRAGEGEVPIPSLLALGSVHNHLIRTGVRMLADIVVETGDALCAHDFACLVGYSASGIYPYMAHDCIRELVARGEIDLPGDEAVANYDRAVTAGITSIMSKMGISTMQGYHSAQIFEIIGLSDELVDRYFTATTTSVGGLGIEGVQREPERALRQRRGACPRARLPTSCRAWASRSGAPSAARSTSSSRAPSTCCNAPAQRVTWSCSASTARSSTGRAVR